MRKILWFTALLILLTIAIGVALAVGLEWSGALQGTTVTVDGESLDTALVAALIGGGVAVGLVTACIVVIGILASVAIAVPLVLIAVAVAVLLALLVGLVPLFVPVLLGVGAYVLLSRRAKRRAAAPAEPFSSAPTVL